MAVTPVEPGRSPRRRVATPPFSLIVTRALGTVVVTVHGELGLSASAPLGIVLADLIDGQGNLAVVVELPGLERVGPAGLEVLSAAAVALERRGGQLRLRRPSPEVSDALMLAGLARLIAVPGEPEGSGRPSTLLRRAVAPPARIAHPAGSNLQPRYNQETC